MDRSDLYAFIWLFVLYFYLILVSNFVPEGPAQKGLQLAGVGILVAGMMITDLAIRERVNKYPYIRARLEPSGQVLRLFIENIKTYRVTKTMWATYLKLKWDIKVRNIGRVKQLVINHEYPWNKRIRFKPGQATWKGYVVDHPQTEHVILYEYPAGSFEIDHAEPIPVYRLRHASGDYYLAPVPLSVAYGIASTSGNPVKKTLPTVLDLVRKNDELASELAEARRMAFEAKKRAIEYEEIIQQQENELKGLLEAKTDHKAAVVEHMLTYAQMHLTIENALKRIKSRALSLTFNKWLALTIISLGALILAYAMRDSLGGLGLWLSSPVNMIFALFVVALICGVLYFVLVSKTRGGK